MRIHMALAMVLASLAAASLALAAGPRITPEEAMAHRGKLVTLVGPVSEVQRRDTDVVLMVGTSARVAVIVPAAAARQLRNPAELQDQTIEVEGFLTPAQPLTIVLEQADRLTAPNQAPTVSPEDASAAEVRRLEAELARLRARTEAPALELKTYGPTVAPTGRVSPNAMEMSVLAERGVPDRVEWSAKKRILVYGTTRYVFDEQGQLIETRTGH